MYYVNHIDFFSIDANVSDQKSLNRTSPDFAPITPPHRVKILTGKAKR